MTDYTITATADDGYEELSATPALVTTVVHIGNDGSDKIGFLIFRGLEIPNGATITSALLDYYLDHYFNREQLEINGAKYDTAPTIDATHLPDTILLTDAQVEQDWSALSYTVGGWSYYTAYASTIAGLGAADITSIIQEIVNRPGWASGNDIALILKNGPGTMSDYGWAIMGDLGSAHPAILSIEISAAPIVTACDTVRPGSVATITGSQLTGATSVRLTHAESGNFADQTIDSNTDVAIGFTVVEGELPPGNLTLTVTTPGGTTDFTVSKEPALTTDDWVLMVDPYTDVSGIGYNDVPPDVTGDVYEWHDAASKGGNVTLTNAGIFGFSGGATSITYRRWSYTNKAWDADGWQTTSVTFTITEVPPVTTFARDSMSQLLAGSNGTGRILVRSFFDGWQATAEGPLGPSLWHYDNTTGGTPTTDTTTAIQTAMQSGRVIDQDGKGWILDKDQDINVHAFGAKGDGSTNDFGALYAMGLYLKHITLLKNKTYRHDSSLAFADQNLAIFMNGAALMPAVDAPGIQFTANYTDEQAISAFAVAAIDLSGGTSSSSNVSRLTVADASAYAVNDMVKILSDDLNSGPDPADTERQGEFAQIMSVDTGNNYLYLSNVLRDTYTTSPRIFKMAKQYKFSIDGGDGELTSVQGLGSSYNHDMIEVIGAYAPVVRNIRCNYSYSGFAVFQGCYAPRTHNLKIANMETSAALYRYAYGVIEYSCEYGEHEQIFAHNIRHLYTTGTLASTAGESAPQKFGRTAYSRVVNCTGHACQSEAFDTHADGFHIDFIGCASYSPYKGPSSSDQGFSLRGQYNRAINCVAYGGNGFSATNDYADSNNSKGHQFINCSWISNPYASSLAAGFNITGQTGAVVTAKIVNCKIEGRAANASPFFSLSYADVEMEGGNIESYQGGTSTARIFQLDNGSNVNWKGGKIDYTNATGTNMRTVRIEDDASSFTWKGGEIVKGSAGWGYLVDFTSNNGTAKFINLNCDAAPGVPAGVANAGGTETAWIDYIVDHGAVGHYGYITLSSAVTGNKDVSLGYRSAYDLTLDYTATATGIAINTLTAGHVLGQRLRIINNPASTFAIDVNDNAAGLIDIGANTTIAIGKSTLLTWNGSAWMGG